MNKIQELLADLRSVTERSQPNVKFREQMDLIEALEAELIAPPIPTESAEPVVETEPSSNVEESTNVGESTVSKRGRKAKAE